MAPKVVFQLFYITCPTSDNQKHSFNLVSIHIFSSCSVISRSKRVWNHCQSLNWANGTGMGKKQLTQQVYPH